MDRTEERFRLDRRNLWYKNAIIYCVDVDSFVDGNGDGSGDFPGLTSSLDYIAGLGVTGLWLLPFYPSPNRDNGYDVKDYYNVDPALGTLGDFVEFMHLARERGIRVIVDLVVNHTSDQHPWFQSACQDRNSPYRDYYVWSETKPPDADEGMIFPGVQESTWTYNEIAKAYYFHRFYRHQPDLNIANPAVRKEITRIMGFWLQMGVSGFRLDAAPFVIELKGIENKEGLDPYQYLREFREFLSWRQGDAILLAEANVPPDKVRMYFGEHSEMHISKLHMLFNFIVNQQLFLALATEQAAPLRESFVSLPEIPPAGQWANFLRNHDELDLGRLSQEERQLVFQHFAPEPSMQLYGRGIRRRLAPMLQGDQRRIQLAYSLLFTLPGTPVLWYGEEIGMGDDLSLEERDSVRTPMQWSTEKNAGFSSAAANALIRPVVSDGPYSYQQINVTNQRRDPESLLNQIERIIRTRKENPTLGWGRWQVIETGDNAVFAHCCTSHNELIIAVHNFAAEPRSVTLAMGVLEVASGHMIDLLNNQPYATINDDCCSIDLDSYGYRWFRIVRIKHDQGREQTTG